jgi:hypothetical protein
MRSGCDTECAYYWGRYLLEIVRDKCLVDVSRIVDYSAQYLQQLPGGSASHLVQGDAVQAGQAER